MGNTFIEKFSNQETRKLPVIILMLAATLLIAPACNKGAETPTALIKMQVEAVKNKDVAAFKKTFSKGAIKQMEDISKPKNLTPEDLLVTLINPRSELQTMPEVRNENIQGDTATLDVKHSSQIGIQTYSGWRTHRFVKEDGGWKEDESPIERVIR